MTVHQIYEMIDGYAPFSSQMEDDNSGLLVGSASQEVDSVLFALDLTDPVIDEAVSLGAGLIVTHHPVMFQPVHALVDSDYEARLIQRLVRENISMIAAHTNLDQASGGVNDALADCCALTNISGNGFFRYGLLDRPCTAREYALQLENSLNTVVRLMGPENTVIRRIGVCSGAGSSEWLDALDTCCDAFVSGEIKHHHALAITGSGLVAFECGHFATEEPGVRALASALQKRINTLQSNMRIYVSELSANCFSKQP